MPGESMLSRYLWAGVLTVFVVIVVVSFARHPLVGGDGEASGFGSPLKLWVAGGGDEATKVAAQAASCWEMNGRSVAVGLLPGGSSAAVADFLHATRAKSDNLLMITSSTVADIARDGHDTLLPEEPRERAQRAQRLLAGATPIAVLASDPLVLAVRADSPIHTTAQLTSLMGQQASRRVFDVAADTWLRGNLAALVRSAGLHGEMPYGVFDSSREALASLDAGEADVAVAPRSTLRDELHAGRLRELRWPAAHVRAPHAWVAILAPEGLSARTVATLRAQAHGSCSRAVWARLLRTEGLTPVEPGAIRLASFVRTGIREATRLQALASQMMRDYG